jgi:hypothetical protein
MKFESAKEAIEHLEKITDSKVIISSNRIAKLPNEDIDKLLFYLQEALSSAKQIPVALAYAIGFFQKRPELMEYIDTSKCIQAEELAIKLYEMINDVECEAEKARGQVRFEFQ